jgi:hypothetical protein
LTRKDFLEHFKTVKLVLFSFLREIESFIYYYSLVADKVFTTTCSIEKVYEEGAKDVVLSALTGMNGNGSYCIFRQKLVI